ncbi:hypothetical protein V6C32_03270 [Desulforamulus ruminis]|uniref:hypothetical protein n=1 Tax=Desulforamulus ruminis TaxID=1564 RepID=UPI002FD8D7C9
MFQKLSWIPLVVPAVVAFGLTRLALTGVMNIITGAGFVRPNFRGDHIPVGVGLLFFLGALLPGGMLIFWQPGLYALNGLIYLLALGAMTLLGLVDDVFGSRTDSGLKGHLKKLFQGELTTGGLKLLAGGLMALVISAAISKGWQELAVNTLVIGLSVNAINLLDLRPGRAGKGYLLALLLLLVTHWPDRNLAWGMITAGALLAYLPTDLRAGAMMGDTGSNALGATLGIMTVLILEGPVKIGYLVFLVVFHLFTEKFSLTKIIERNRLLNYLDQLGRS